MRRFLLSACSLALLSACGDEADAPELETEVAEVETEQPAPAVIETESGPISPAEAVAAIPDLPPLSEERLAADIRVLASDEFEGRAPATAGGAKTREYLAARMEEIGLEPVNGSYEQPVPLVELTVDPEASFLTVTLEDGTERALSYGDEAVFWTKRVEEEVAFDDSEVVFVGFGVNAPEYGWNDYERLDIEGKTVVMLVNDPGFYLQGEEFKGREMTYYGRWTYKFEEAARQGAAAAIIVHEAEAASYGWGVVEGSWSGPQLDLQRTDGGASRAAAEAWITKDVAEELMAAAGYEYEELKEAALSAGFEPVALEGLTASARLVSSIKRSESANVTGILPGTERADEVVLYMAHWDHIGAPGGAEGDDQIYNGAVDNATGTAGLLAVAQSMIDAGAQPERSVMFLAVTAEESGLLGSAYYAEDPLVPLGKTVGGINMDAIAPTGPARDLIVVGYGASELEDVLKAVADREGKVLRPDASPEAGYFYRSDHISLAKKGVPMIYVDKGIDLLDGGEAAGRAAEADYTENRYHKPGDEYDPATWRMDGLAQTLTILRDTGAALAYTGIEPNWYEGNEFRALRDEQLGGD
jgi:Zn-dependent M28 family amino/carboxypeptidase